MNDITIKVFGSDLAAMAEDAREQIGKLIGATDFEVRMTECEPGDYFMTGKVAWWEAKFEVVEVRISI